MTNVHDHMTTRRKQKGKGISYAKTRAVRLYGESDLRLEEFDMGELKDDEILMELITDSVCMSTYKRIYSGSKTSKSQR